MYVPSSNRACRSKSIQTIFLYPAVSCLGFVNERPIHVVAADDAQAEDTIIITVYEPKSEDWVEDFTKRRA